MKYPIRLSLVALCVLLASTCVLANDPAAEFSITKNPNGIWSYGYTTTLGSPLILFTHSSVNYWNPRDDHWNVPGLCWDGSPVVDRNLSFTTPDRSPFVPPDTLIPYPGCNGEYAVVRWTAPIAGTYKIHSYFQGIQFLNSTDLGTTTDVHVLWNSATSLIDDKINGFGHVVFFDLLQQVNASDTFDFAVGYGDNKNFFADGTALYLNIDFVPSVVFKPGSADNRIHMGKSGPIRLAILSDSSFVAPKMIDRNSLTFGRIGNELSLIYKPDQYDTRLKVPVCSASDVNGDGLPDLVCQFDQQQLGFELTDTNGIVRGKTTTGITIEGTVSVQVVQ